MKRLAMTRPRFPILVAIAVLVTLLTGYFIGNWVFNFGGTLYWEWGYGFPFPWITGGCPPPGSGILARCVPIGYNWLVFGLDVLFYTAVGYGFLLVYLKVRPRRPKGS